MRLLIAALLALFVASIPTDGGGAKRPRPPKGNGPGGIEPPTAPAPTCARTLRAQVVALDQVFTYNRFGAFNPVGMIYALRRDVVAMVSGTTPGPGNVQLRPGKRPRPLVLRMNAEDCLDVEFTNWLSPTVGGGDAPRTRSASFHVNGLAYRDAGADGAHVGRNTSSLAAPGETRTYRFHADREGVFFAHSMGATAGSEGDGGATALGLFAAVAVEPAGSVWYRSQVSAEDLRAATTGANEDGTPRIDYDARYPGSQLPVLRILDDALEIVHGDLNAIVTGYPAPIFDAPSAYDEGQFREFVILFHDELKAVQAFAELDLGPFHGVRDGFGINYGASGMGSILLSQRRKVGPAAGCAECKFEEFFLTSWANGDPALNVEPDALGRAGAALWPDDPSNVAHSYLGDPVRLRNLHAGPKETHVFHLHGHQWLHNPGSDLSTYLDSQTLGPGSAFSYDVNYGGSGNRNYTPGDAIFHCHLYPHFAQGMWGLWRNHDTFEAGTPDRWLPDGEIAAGTPTPAVVPMPRRAMPPLPTYAETTVTLPDGTKQQRPPMPGYPFYLAAEPGHRPPQPPLDIVRDGGLPRHRVAAVHEIAPGETLLDADEILAADLLELPQNGTSEERAAMDFHAGLHPGAERRTNRYGWPAASYPAFTPAGDPARFYVNGQPPRPGAPFADPCPPGAPMRTYRASYLQLDLVVNETGWHDPQGRLIVLDDDVDATLSGERPPEPFFFRANSGDCIQFAATNRMPAELEEDDFQVRTPTDTVGQHIHLVKFDLTASDGSANGWNYEDATFAAEEVIARIEAANVVGGIVGPGGRRILHPTRSSGLPDGAQTTVQRWWADPLLNAAGDDRTIRSVFTHDHLAPSSQQQHGFYAGLVIEPAGATWRDPETGATMGTRPDGGPTSYRADILVGGGGKESFREFNLAFADFAIVYDGHGDPVNPPTFRETRLPFAVEHAPVRAPEIISTGDPGTMLINYANEPIPLRIATRAGKDDWRLKPDAAGRMENVFRSDLHGDPFTPVLRGYEGDQVQINLIQGAQEEQHVFSVNGHRWAQEISDGDAGFVNAQPIGISEHFEFHLAGGLQQVKNLLGTADYLYQSTPTDDLWNGMWGILRAHGVKQPDLLPLPNNPPPSTQPNAVHPCPAGAPKRAYTVHAITAKGNLPGGRLVYNERFGLYDPDAILFARAEHLPGLRAGTRKPEPLILRANAGDCIAVKVVNELPASISKLPHWNYSPPITEHFNTNQVPISSHVSLHPQLVQYDVNQADGPTVGFNLQQDVQPGGVRTFEWYAGAYKLGGKGRERLEAVPLELGAINLRSMSDVVNHGVHGAFGALVVEPAGATWETDPGTDAQATVRYVDKEGYTRTFREFVLVLQDEVALHSDRPQFQCGDVRLNCGTALRNYGGADDAEDSGHKAFNYRTEPFWARLGIPPQATEGLGDLDLSGILSSAHGDPETPIFRAKAGDAVRFRILAPSGHPRQHAFTLHGHAWARFPWAATSAGGWMGDNLRSYVIGTQGGVSAMTAWNANLLGGAGGRWKVAIDYLYRDQASMQFGNGLWGLLRVEP
ncbi:copper oxidase [Vulgatibacter sp.]|uniref:copper oxidase n=1 Tax=Vulgatibacter sp. TaxID=1971226 RepID=UPI00356316C7